MTPAQFELDDARYEAWITGILAGTGITDFDEVVAFNIEILVVAATDDPSFHNASDPLLLAWFVYLLGMNDCWRGPDGFGPKAISAHATRGPEEGDETLLLKVRHDFGPAIAVGPLPVQTLVPGWHPSTIEQGRRWHRIVAEALIAEANSVIETALGAANPPETIVLTQKEIDELDIQPVGSYDSDEVAPDGLAKALQTQGTANLSGKRFHWSIQAYASTENTLNAELFDPVAWETGPALPQELIVTALQLGFKAETGMWVLRIPLGRNEEAALEEFVDTVSDFVKFAEKD